ncbi:MAG: hypothetical protein DRJ60_07125 [Thermoprotei archaeon]|nr:MAG: hypothetical protein DRJ60_07125 [Thermoprotei archaeon]
MSLKIKEEIKVILEISELEGEDITLRRLCSMFNVEMPFKLREYGDLPPRIALAIAYLDRELRELLKEASQDFIREKIHGLS